MEVLGTLNFWLWAAQVVLLLMYGLAGGMKTFRPIPELAKQLAWAAELPPALTRFIGVAEGLGALGMVLPMLTGILPWLTPLAAAGLGLIQVLAIGFHARRGETARSLPINLVLLALSAFVLWGRWSLFGGA